MRETRQESCQRHRIRAVQLNPDKKASPFLHSLTNAGRSAVKPVFLFFFALALLSVLFGEHWKNKHPFTRQESTNGHRTVISENLNEILRNSTTGKTALKLICERLNLLNKFIVSHISPNYSAGAEEELQRLMQDKKHFMKSTKVSFEIENPGFIAYLVEKGLSDYEIGYCCFYAMGLKGKDIGNFMGNGHYKISSAIRKKLGLTEHDTNLDIYLRKVFKEKLC